jgi:hypothetical protein
VRRIVLAVTVVAVLSGVLSAVPAVAASAQPLVLVPAYFAATGTPNPWDTMCGAMGQAGPGSVAILNPDNGPGHKANPDYAAAISYCHLEGQRVIGYVYTRSAKRSLAKVEADIDKYFTYYPTIDGIFVDNMADVPTAKAKAPCSGCKLTVASYYSDLYAYVHDKGSGLEVIGNPGDAAATSWQLTTPVADAVVIFEGSSTTYQSFKPPSWAQQVPTDEIANIVYAAPSSSLASDCALATADGAGLVYVTNLALKPNPYAALPSYWTTETATC